MSREDLNNFIHAVNHSQSLRKRLKECTNKEKLLKLAAEYGFHLTDKDFAEDKDAEKISNWFNQSEINPFRNPS